MKFSLSYRVLLCVLLSLCSFRGQAQRRQAAFPAPTSAPAEDSGLHANQYRARRDAAQLLQRYADWQVSQSLQSAAQPVR